jgi:hypothetical protein
VICSSPVEFNVVIDIPLTLVGAVVVGEKEKISFLEKIANFFMQPAFADPVLGATVQVVGLNPNGTVSKIYNSTSAVVSDGSYRVTLNSAPRVDLAFLISQTSAVLGQALPTEAIYSIASETNVRIDIASTVAVSKILKSITSFDSLTKAEVSAVIAKAQTVALTDPNEGQSLQDYIENVADPAIDPVIADDIIDIADIDRYSMAYLAGKTLYNVWFGGVNDVNGNMLPGDNPGIDRLDFGANGTMTITSLQTGRVTTASYQVGDNGRFHGAGDDTQGGFVVCGGTDEYLKTHHIVNGEFDNTDLMFFNETDALDYVSTLSQPISPCQSELPGPIIGSWLYSEGPSSRNVLTFIDNSRYIMIHEHDDAGGAPGSQTAGSVEFGNYTWNGTTYEFSVSLIGESDGWGGLYDGGSTVSSAQVTGDSLTLSGPDGDSFVLTRVIEDSNPLVGAWLLGNQNNINVLTFLSGSEYVMAHTGNTEAYGTDLPQALSGEFGTYTLINDTFSTYASVDTDGDGGLYDIDGTNEDNLILQSPDELFFDNGPGDQATFTRIRD